MQGLEQFMRKKLIAGNWKMHGSRAANEALVQALRAEPPLESVELAVLVPAPYLAQMQQLLGGSACAWGGQDVSDQERGAFTGEVAASMLREFGCRYTVVGHSEQTKTHAAQRHEQMKTIGQLTTAVDTANFGGGIAHGQLRVPSRCPMRNNINLAMASTMVVMMNSSSPSSISAEVYRSPTASANSLARDEAMLFPGASSEGLRCWVLPITKVTAMVSPRARPNPS